MFLVDLAGSERISVLDEYKPSSTKETIGINKSLMTLRKVITGLAEN